MTETRWLPLGLWTGDEAQSPIVDAEDAGWETGAASRALAELLAKADYSAEWSAADPVPARDARLRIDGAEASHVIWWNREVGYIGLAQVDDDIVRPTIWT